MRAPLGAASRRLAGRLPGPHRVTAGRVFPIPLRGIGVMRPCEAVTREIAANRFWGDFIFNLLSIGTADGSTSRWRGALGPKIRCLSRESRHAADVGDRPDPAAPVSGHGLAAPCFGVDRERSAEAGSGCVQRPSRANNRRFPTCATAFTSGQDPLLNLGSRPLELVTLTARLRQWGLLARGADCPTWAPRVGRGAERTPRTGAGVPVRPGADSAIGQSVLDRREHELRTVEG